jgi:hypothetical protein
MVGMEASGTIICHLRTSKICQYNQIDYIKRLSWLPYLERPTDTVRRTYSCSLGINCFLAKKKIGTMVSTRYVMLSHMLEARNVIRVCRAFLKWPQLSHL